MIKEIGLPTLVISHNKTLAEELIGEVGEDFLRTQWSIPGVSMREGSLVDLPVVFDVISSENLGRNEMKGNG